MHPVWERLVILLLVLLSASVFARNLHRKLRPVFQGASDRVRIDRVPERLLRTLKEVFLQTRVIGQRPIVGVLHAVVFLGFLSFAPETVEHFAEGLGFSLLGPLLGGLLPAYRSVMFIIAIGVALGIVGLAIRRFVLVKYSPDPKSWTSAVVAGFIFVLMLTYLNGMSAEPIAARASWWIHALVILAFPHLIIKSKHFHLILAPVSVFLRTDRLGEYLPLDLESIAESEDVDEITLGLEKVKNLSWKSRLDFLTCVECRRCTDSCPAALAGNEVDPRAMVLAGRKALFESQPDDSVVGTVISEDALGFCATCGGCENACAVGVEHLQILVGAKRAQTLASGKGVVASEYLRAIESHGNAFRLPASDRRAMLKEFGIPKFSGGEDEWLLWLGCVWGFNTDQRPAVKAFKDVLDAAGVKYGVLDEEPCCGHHSRRQGEEAQFQDLARRSLEILEEKKVRRIVTPCPHCLHTLRREHSQFNGHLALTIKHHSELIADLLDRDAIRIGENGRLGRKAAFHDPCYLARFERQSVAPREILEFAGVSVTELPHHGSRTLCCGGGAAGFVREIKKGQRLDQPRRAEIRGSGAALLVTACPECRMMLDASVEETRDIVEIVAEAILKCQTANLPSAKQVSEDQPGSHAPAPAAGSPAAGVKGGQMLKHGYSEDLATKILGVFEECPTAEMQLLNVAGRVHYNGKLCELVHAADHLVETGDLQVLHHGGGRYYKLSKQVH